jgi:hypothetical protein
MSTNNWSLREVDGQRCGLSFRSRPPISRQVRGLSSFLTSPSFLGILTICWPGAGVCAPGAGVGGAVLESREDGFLVEEDDPASPPPPSLASWKVPYAAA